MKPTANRIFSALFALLLLTPLAFTDPTGGGVSEQENRALVSRPRLAEFRRWPSDFLRQFERWFSDNVGFREPLIRLHRPFAAGGFLPYDDESLGWLAGQEGHLFYYSNIPRYQGKSILTDDQKQTLANWLRETKRYLDERDIPLVTMLCADKESIYPEYYSRAIMRGPEPVQLDILTDYLKEHAAADVFNIRQCLLAEKHNYLLYNKNVDIAHYNEIGAFFAYVELMKHVRSHLPGITPPLSVEDIVITYDANGIPDVSLKAGPSYRMLSAGFFDDLPLEWPYAWSNIAYENNDSTLPVILVFRDSYAGYYAGGAGGGDLINQYLPQHFGRTIFVHHDPNIKHIEQCVARYKPDIVVIEIVERLLYAFTNNISDFRYTGSFEQ